MEDTLERLAILGAKVQVYPNGITKLDLEGVKMPDIVTGKQIGRASCRERV